METTIDSRTDSHVEFTVTLNQEQLQRVVKHVYDDLRPRVKAAGFRPGKAPDMIVEREMGSSTVQGEVIDHAIQESYSAAIRQHDLQVVAQPQVNLEKFVPYTELQYKVSVELMPKVTLPDYQNYRISRPKVEVNADQIKATLSDLQRREAARQEALRAAAMGDEVNFDFAGTKDGQPVRGASAQGQTLMLGSNQFIPGFEDNLVGMSVGDEKTFDITFPKDYHETSLAGQVVTFEVTLNKVTELVLPKLDDAFAAKVGPFKTLDELKTNIQAQAETQQAESASRDYEQKILDKLVADTTYKAPDALVKQQLDRLKGELEQNLAYSGLNLNKYRELSGKTAEQMDDEMRPEAEKRVGLAMVLTEVAAAEKISVSPADLEAELARMKAQYQDAATQAELDKPETREEIYNHLMASRVIAKLVSYAEQTKGPEITTKKPAHKADKASKPASPDKA